MSKKEESIPRVVLSADIVLRRPSGTILFIRRKNAPFKGMLALPGGVVEENETSLEAAKRELFEETNVQIHDLEFVGVSDDPDRDPRGRTVSIAYAANVSSRTQAVAGDDAAAALWLPWAKAQKEGIAFDHDAIISKALEVLLRD
jgi:8-oxo-dGTP diphosphatase